jgi:predicted dehydrogenase
MKPPIKAIMIGAGQRGYEAYGPYASDHPDQLQFTAVAEPDAERRVRFASRHNIPVERQYESWEPLLIEPQLGEAALICTQDWLHVEPALAAMAAGYHLLLEKPMATQAEDCRALIEASEQHNRQLHICHVLRHTKHFSRMRELVQSGALGQVVNVDHRENVSYWHMAHSFVRGNWRRSGETSPMILAKCCHDFDILIWVLGSSCRQLSSFGGLMHFTPENAPTGAPARCLDGCPTSSECPYYAPFIYEGLTPLWRSYIESARGLPRMAAALWLRYPSLVRVLSGVAPALRAASKQRGWPVSVLTRDPTPDNIRSALENGPYGRCVYHCDNDVVDQQVVAMQFENGVSATLTMQGHSYHEHRTTRIEGTRATLRADFGFGGSRIILDEHRSGKRTVENTTAKTSSGHGGGDATLMAAFVRSLRGEGAGTQTTAAQALESHLLAFAAEHSRLKSVTVDMQAVY